MTSLEKKLRASLKRLGITAELPVIVAVSGGADSTALLDALVRIGFNRIVAAHLNHQLRGEESDDDERFVIDLAARLNLKIRVERIDVAQEARKQKGNLEAVARKLRYQFLQRVAEQDASGVVFTAHTRNDQAETILMRLIRGAGPDGLRGIQEIRLLAPRIKLIRPMLYVTRAETVEYCAKYHISYRDDSSNFKADFTRNRIRQELLPLLRSFNPQIEEAVIRASRLISDDEECLAAAALDLFAAAADDHALIVDKLKNQKQALRRRVIRLWLERRRGDLSRIDWSRVDAIDNLITRGGSGRRIELPGGLYALREFDLIVLKRSNRDVSSRPQKVRLLPGKPCDFAGFSLILTRHVSRESIKVDSQAKTGIYLILLRDSSALDDLYLRVREPGDAYRPAGSRNRMKLKTLMIRHKIPLSERADYPVTITGDGRIVWVPGLPAAHEFAIDPSQGGEIDYALISAGRKRNRDAGA